MTDEPTKKCSKCGRELPVSEYHKNKAQKDGLQTYCKECKKESNKLYSENHYEEISKKRKVYHDNHRDEILKKKKEYYENNHNYVSKQMKVYYKCVTNPSCPRVGGRGAVFETFTCEICGAEFRRLKSRVDWDYEHNGFLPRFCSRECQSEAKRKSHKSKYEKEIERIKKEVG